LGLAAADPGEQSVKAQSSGGVEGQQPFGDFVEVDEVVRGSALGCTAEK
jgi:hypothetical protein